ncbi:MAG: hypothetical protein HW402_111 [Dehalococcoidales bacterium]|nr:hypothetical protein [Dehalococcoidales bacterium]
MRGSTDLQQAISRTWDGNQQHLCTSNNRCNSGCSFAGLPDMMRLWMGRRGVIAEKEVLK